MFVLKPKAQIVAAAALALLMAVTRVHHFGIGNIAPDASTGVFFLAGLLVAPVWFLGALLVEAVALDAFAIGWVKVADACMSSGYALLAPAYGALWFAGRALRGVEKIDVVTAGKFVCFVVAGTAVFFIISNLGYFFGSEFYMLGIAEYVSRVTRYFPMYLTVTLFYVAFGLAVYAAARRIVRVRTASVR